MASTADDRTGELTTGRRWLLHLGAAGAGAAVVASVAAANPASAATGTPTVTGQTDNWGTTQTGFVHNGTTQNGPAVNAYRTSGISTGVQYSENAGVVAETTFKDNDGVIGFCAG